MKRLSQDSIIAMHSELVLQSGGLDGIRDINMLVFLDINDLPVTCTNDELVMIGVGLADSSITESELIEWIITHS